MPHVDSAIAGPARTDGRTMIGRWWRVAAGVGPGLVVMLADTEAGSVITSAQSGAEWEYRLLALQFLIVPLLFMAQELTVRLGLGTGKGYGELIRRRYGRGVALLSGAVLAISCFGTLLTQMSGLGGVGQLFGIPLWRSVTLIAATIFAILCSGSYRSVERIALLLGLCGLAFLIVAWEAHPDPQAMLRQLRQMPLGDHRYLYLAAANLGTGLMPWALFYQQSALIDKGLTPRHLKLARIETLSGALLCQTLQAAVLVAAAATLGGSRAGGSLDNIPQIAQAFTAVLGDTVGRVVFALGLSGGALVATIVVCLTAVWAVGEALGQRHSPGRHPCETPWLYGGIGLMLIAGGAVVCSGVSLIDLSIATGVVNALLLPVVLFFLYRLARTALPSTLRLRGAYACLVGLVFLATAGFSLYVAITGAAAVLGMPA